MFRRLINKAKNLFSKGKEKKHMKKDEMQISKNIEENYKQIEKLFAKSEDVTIRRFIMGKGDVKAFALFIDGMINKKLVDDDILKPLMLSTRSIKPSEEKIPNVYNWVKERVLVTDELKETTSFKKSVDAALSGDAAIFIDGYDRALLASTRGWEERGVQPPTTETLIRGPKEAFTETLRINTSLLRRKIKNTKFKLESMVIGEVTGTQVVIGYIEGLANPKIVKEVKKRLKDIEVDSILDTGYIEEYIEDNPLSPLPTMHRTERPDAVASKLLEGKVTILVDGSPSALTAPTIFMEFLLTSADYYQRAIFSTFTRWLRYISFVITLLLPALYVAVISFHQEMLPTPLIITIAAEREGVPFPSFVEAILMGLMFEVLREAGTRMPRPIGQAVSIVGALILGDAAVKAVLTSTPMIIITALTGIGVFVIPSVDMALTLIPLRFLLALLAATLGLFGILLGMLIITIHMASLRSFGIPYLSPLAPGTYQGLKDTLVRAPWWAMNTRPQLMTENEVRQDINQKPQDPEDNEENLIDE
ncbi:spore germination protein KA [Candidatus Frackibacter sp. WG12]|uniref:spore germination protein n=1 Tax=Candidatus Frackibacter sp. WG12 TaxID=2017977 RepID=UPI0008CA223A|nr:spore germination protein [Candidatus Frackibacter sp. WG12]SEM50829.1 spore germination protein KA [Candidatus Frackibacter sp. WG12]